jgi:hypothetical protein
LASESRLCLQRCLWLSRSSPSSGWIHIGRLGHIGHQFPFLSKSRLGYHAPTSATDGNMCPICPLRPDVTISATTAAYYPRWRQSGLTG